MSETFNVQFGNLHQQFKNLAKASFVCIVIPACHEQWIRLNAFFFFFFHNEYPFNSFHLSFIFSSVGFHNSFHLLNLR